ncbi:MAG: HAMP domain-containing histidine kinase, partial [Clostridia bacterium]|nr:HAMP domain-containing histidine kinase [Clostridia bacterium]
MKKPRIKYGKWKDWKRPSFHFYFVLFTVIVTVVTVWVASIFSSLIEKLIDNPLQIHSVLLLLGFSLVIGYILSFFIGMFLLKPISKLQSKMNEVTEGDLTINIEEKSRFDEIENIYHSFNIMMKELRSTQAIQKDFVSNVSHEFKTPLSAIEGYATLLEDKTITEEEREEYVKEILSTTREMTELVGNLLLLSKIENQAIDYKEEIFSLDEQIRKVVVLLEPKWSAKNIEFDVDFDDIDVKSNDVLLANVWRNLIENAIKFSPDGGRIEIVLKKRNNGII